MLQIYPDVALVPLLQRIVVGDLHFHIFNNNVTPDQSSVLATFHEPGGVTPVLVHAADFTLTGVAGHVGGITALAIALTNAFGAPIDGYGYFVTDVGNTILLWAARFDAAPIVKNNTETWLVTPTIGDFSQAAS